ncbi:unnamed protein product [Owenia fusiformis]|uniref:FAD-binding PCMH-type domain-containing protein n=1 Tax=Owenia fusiformis TaxID=6347 RepID=A0A8S4PZ72_OWEFU|nr:unnamed protein product [Owenia fusiformis]
MLGISQANVDANLESKRMALEATIGYPVDIIIFNDTAGRQSAKILWVKPTTVRQIQLLVRGANNLNLKMRVVGAAHTFSALYPDPLQIGVSLDDFRGEKYHLNEKRDKLTVLSSERLEDVLKWAAGKGVTFGPVPDALVSTIPGITATSSHSTGVHFGPFANMVYGYELVDGSANVRKINEDDNKEIIDACRVHLGLCGIIYKTVLKVLPDRIQRLTIANIPIKKLLDNENRKNLVINNLGAQLNLNYDFKSATEKEMEKMLADPLRRIPDSYDIFKEEMRLWLWSDVDQNTRLRDIYNDTITLADGSEYDAVSVIKPFSATSTGLLSNSKYQCYQFRTSVSFAAPESDDFTESNKTIMNHLTILEDIFKDVGFYPHFGGSWIRWMKHFDNCLLCTTKVADDSSKYRLVTFTEMSTDFDKCEEPLISEEHSMKQILMETQFGVSTMKNNPRVVPHWAKHFQHIPGTTDQIRRHFGNDLRTFINLRNKYGLDYKNLFLNNHLKDIFRDAFVKFL